MVTKKLCDTNKNVIQMSMIVKGVHSILNALHNTLHNYLHPIFTHFHTKLHK